MFEDTARTNSNTLRAVKNPLMAIAALVEPLLVVLPAASVAIKPVTVFSALLAVLSQEASQRMRTRSIIITRTGHIAARASTALVFLKASVKVRALAGRRTRGCDEEWDLC